MLAAIRECKALSDRIFQRVLHPPRDHFLPSLFGSNYFTLFDSGLVYSFEKFIVLFLFDSIFILYIFVQPYPSEKFYILSLFLRWKTQFPCNAWALL